MDQLVDTLVSSQRLESLHAVKLKVVVDVRECESLCCEGPSRC